MRLTNWLFAISVALFLSGIGFIIAGARTAQLATPVEARAPEMAPVATVKQLMDGIIGPSATVVFDSVGTTVDATGIHEKQPSTDPEWAAVGASAAALVEAANLLMVGDRAVDKGEWATTSKALADAGQERGGDPGSRRDAQRLLRQLSPSVSTKLIALRQRGTL